MTTQATTPPCHTPREFWSKHREASLNWLALGLLLAAWNAADSRPADRAEGQTMADKGHKSVNEL